MDTAVTRLKAAPGWYTANLPPAWNFLTPCGGVLMTVAMRAMQEELNDPELRPLSANTHFCSPVPAGPLEVRVEVLRHGGAAAQMRAQLSSTTVPGPGLEVSATFGRERDGVDVIDTAPPDVPGPEQAQRWTRWSARYRASRCSSRTSRRAWRQATLVAARLGRRPGAPDALVPVQGAAAPRRRPVRSARPSADRRHHAAGADPEARPEHEPFHAPSLDLTVHFLEDTTPSGC